MFFLRNLAPTFFNQLSSDVKYTNSKHANEIEVLNYARERDEKLSGYVRREKRAESYRRMQHGGEKEELNPQVKDIRYGAETYKIGSSSTSIEQVKGHKVGRDR